MNMRSRMLENGDGTSVTFTPKEFGQVRKQFHLPLRNSDSAAKSRIMDDTRLTKGNYYGGKLPIVSASTPIWWLMKDYGTGRQLNLGSAEHGFLCG